jgi:HK97 gp10 family phage protein
MFKLTAQLQAVGEQFTVEDLLKGAEVFLTHAQTLCPVDTGALRDSGHLVPETDDVQIVFDAIYASYVEYGTWKMEAQPYLRPAMDEAETEAMNAIYDSIDSHFKDLAKGGVQTTSNPSGFLQP